MLTHVVLFWLKPDAPADTATRLIGRAQAELTGIPGVRHLNAGAPIPTTRAIVDTSYQVGLSMQFANAEELDAYQIHPVHQRYVKECVQPNTSKVLVYDFTAP